MDRELYRRFRDHPIREVLSRAAQGIHIYPDEIEDLQLPKNLQKALKQAIDRVKPGEDGSRAQEMGPGSPDNLAAELVQSLPPEHETKAQQQERRAAAGDPEAQASVQARSDYYQDLADKIHSSSSKGVINL